VESHHDLIALFEHDFRANAFRVCREGKPVSFRIMLLSSKACGTKGADVRPDFDWNRKTGAPMDRRFRFDDCT